MAKDQSSLLEELRQRQHTAQIRLKEASDIFQASQQALATAQATFQKSQAALSLAQQQMQGWSIALVTVEAEEAERLQVKNEKQLDLPAVSETPETQPPTSPLQQPEGAAEAGGKTEMIRDLVRQHPQGITATEIWSHVQDRFNHRAYLYNILKRLTKNGEFSERKGKYVSRIAAPEVRQEGAAMVH
jgi:hypothetical protein